jgi:hypothetical protein
LITIQAGRGIRPDGCYSHHFGWHILDAVRFLRFIERPLFAVFGFATATLWAYFVTPGEPRMLFLASLVVPSWTFCKWMITKSRFVDDLFGQYKRNVGAAIPWFGTPHSKKFEPDIGRVLTAYQHGPNAIGFSRESGSITPTRSLFLALKPKIKATIRGVWIGTLQEKRESKRTCLKDPATDSSHPVRFSRISSNAG